MTYRIVKRGRRLGAYASPATAVIEAMRAIGAEITVVGENVYFEGETFCSVDDLVAQMQVKPLKGVRIVAEP